MGFMAQNQPVKPSKTTLIEKHAWLPKTISGVQLGALVFKPYVQASFECLICHGLGLFSQYKKQLFFNPFVEFLRHVYELSFHPLPALL